MNQDNGSTFLTLQLTGYDQPVELTLDQCIKCNICTTACPVSGITDLFPGPKYAGPQAGRYRGADQPSPDHSVDYCSGCRVCNMVCPTGVKIAEMNARARAGLVADGKVPVKQRLRNNLIARSELLGKVSLPIAPLANAVLSNSIVRQLTETLIGIHHSAPLPAFAAQRFTTWYASHEKPVTPLGQVVYFHGCSTEYYEPRVGRAAVGVLETLGFEVLIPPQNCCGLPLLSNGEFAAAERYHRNNVSHLAPFARESIPIVGTSTSCTLTLKEEAPELLDMHDADSQLVAAWTFDFNEFLLQIIEARGDLPKLRSLPLTLPYHIPCQYRAHRLGKPGVEVLSWIPELQILDSHADCCGIAGTYGYKKEKYDIAMQVGQPLFEFVRKSGSSLILCDSETCRWQITHATGKPAIHPVELLAAALGLPVEEPLAGILKAHGLLS